MRGNGDSEDVGRLDVGNIRVGLARRQTRDSRSYKIMSSVVGETMEFVIRPAELRAVAKVLVGRFEIDGGVDLVIGFAPSGSPIAVAVASELELPLLIAYKKQMPLADVITFKELHTFEDTFYLYGLKQGRVLLVDDEIDSGETLAGAVSALGEHGIRVVDVGVGVEALHGGVSKGRGRMSELGLDLKSVKTFEVEDVAEENLRGEWEGGEEGVW